MINKLMVICPTRYRAPLLERMLDSYREHSGKASDIFFIFQKEDEDLFKNMEIAGSYEYIILDNIGFCKKVNIGVLAKWQYRAFMVLNDDQIIHTPEWDKIIIDKLDSLPHPHHILHWRDGISDEKLPQGFATHETLSLRNFIYYPINLQHTWSDNFYKYIGDQCGILEYMPDIYIEHCHFMNDKAPKDKNYEESSGNSKVFDTDKAIFNKWKKEEGKALIRKIKRAIKK